MTLKDVVEDKKGNIGALTSYLNKRPEMIQELKSNFNFDISQYTTPELLRCFLLNDFTQQNCRCGAKLKWKDFKNGWRHTCGKKECVIQQTTQTNIEKFGFKPKPNIDKTIDIGGRKSFTKSVTEKIKKEEPEANIDKVKDVLKVKGNGWEYVSYKIINNNIIYTLKKDENFIDISKGNLKFKLKNDYDLEPNTGIFKLKKYVLDYVKSIYSGIIYDNYKSDDIELDIYIPEYQIGIEVNGLYQNSEIYKDKKCHINKSDVCEKQGITLIHLWEDDLYEKRDIIESRLSNVLKRTTNRLYARKCKLVIVDYKEAKQFLDETHLQGFVMGKYYYGLTYDGLLVSLMSFGGKRKFMNSVSEEGAYEVYRFSNKMNYNVVGGASMILKKFIEDVKPKEIISYADKCWGNSKLYKSLGFEFLCNTDLGYFWCINEKRYHRYKFRKQELIKEGYDSNKTEIQIMHERGYYRIWDCGNEKWILKFVDK